MSTRVVGVHEAKSRLSELIREAAQGVEVIVTRHGKPVAKIIAWPTPRAERVPGAWAGRVRYGDDLVGPDPYIQAQFGTSPTADGAGGVSVGGCR